MKKLIIFDLDGTLIDTLSVEISRYNKILKDLGYARMDEDAKLYMTKSTPEELLDSLTDDPKKLKKAIALRWETDLNLDELKLFNGVIDLLKTLKETGEFEFAIASSRGLSAHKLLEYFDIEKYFKTSVLLRDYEKLKPDPECINLVMERLGWLDKKENVYYIGDMLTDMQASKDAGVTFIGYGKNFEEIKDVEHFMDFKLIKKYFLELLD